MTLQRVDLITLWLLAIGTIATLAALVFAAGSAVSLFSLFTLWALLPYGVLLLSRFCARSLGRALVVLAISMLTVGSALLAYGNALRPSSGSTSALGFIAVPFYQLLVAVLLLGVLFFTRPSNHRRP
jgi:hypothetical protein